MARFGDESGADLTAEFCSNRNILQIRIGRRQPAGGCPRLAERRMNAAATAANQRRKGINIRGFQLGKLSVLQAKARNFMLFREAFEDIDAGRYLLSLAILHRNREAELVEEDVAELLGRVDVELERATFVNVDRLRVGFALQLYGHLAERGWIDLHAGSFHAREDRHEGRIDSFVYGD